MIDMQWLLIMAALAAAHTGRIANLGSQLGRADEVWFTISQLCTPFLYVL